MKNNAFLLWPAIALAAGSLGWAAYLYRENTAISGEYKSSQALVDKLRSETQMLESSVGSARAEAKRFKEAEEFCQVKVSDCLKESDKLKNELKAMLQSQDLSSNLNLICGTPTLYLHHLVTNFIRLSRVMTDKNRN